MSIDLDAIKARLDVATSGPWWTDETAEMDAVLIANAPGDITALVAEVERLRDEAVLLRTGRDAAREYADRVEADVLFLRGERTAEDERADVVAYLAHAREFPFTHASGIPAVLDALYDLIEQGHHEGWAKKEKA